MDRVPDVLVSRAAAEVSLQRMLEVLIARVLRFLEDGEDTHQKAGCAETTL